MRSVILRGLAIVLVVAFCHPPAPAFAVQSPPPAIPATPPDAVEEQAPPAPEFDLERIRDALGRRSLKLDGAQRRFYLRVVGKSHSVYDFFDDRDMLSGPVPDAQMTHREYVQMITPQLMYSTVGIRPREMIEWAFSEWFLSEALKFGRKRLVAASTAWERRRIQQQIDRELAALAQLDARRKRQ